MDKRYQVFISSTYEDLREERQEVMHVLLELDCIPSGMELFPAANDDQWSVIKKVIEECDYYVVIVGGRYGSIGPDGLSYTENEYRYAEAIGKPCLAFLHEDPEKLTLKRSEKSPEGKKKLEVFRNLLKQRLCKMWSNPDDLGSVVSRGLSAQFKSNPGIGWVRADLLPDEDSIAEILQLRKKVDDLEKVIGEERTEPPKGAESLKQGEDAFEIIYDEGGDVSLSMTTSRNEIIKALGPHMINEASESTLFKRLRTLLHEETEAGYSYISISLHLESFNIIIVQLRALGLIEKNNKSRSVKDTDTYWSLTPYGDSVMTDLLALHR